MVYNYIALQNVDSNMHSVMPFALNSQLFALNDINWIRYAQNLSE